MFSRSRAATALYYKPFYTDISSENTIASTLFTNKSQKLQQFHQPFMILNGLYWKINLNYKRQILIYLNPFYYNFLTNTAYIFQITITLDFI
jgi:hypothetical protein